MDETTTSPIQATQTQDETSNVPTNSADAAKAVTEALGNSVIPDRIVAREEPVTAEPETPIEETPPVEETPEPVSETPAPTQEPAPEATPAEEEPEEYIPPAQQVSLVDPKSFADENGYVDVNKLTEAINGAISSVQQTASATAQRELAAQRAEERLWNQATEKFPDLKTDRTLRDLVQNARIGKVTEIYRNAMNDPQRLAQVRIPTPAQIATDLFKRMGQAKTEGIQAATETTTVAQSTQVLPSGNAAPTTTKREELFKDIRNPNRIEAEKAQRELLKDLLFQ